MPVEEFAERLEVAIKEASKDGKVSLGEGLTIFLTGITGLVAEVMPIVNEENAAEQRIMAKAKVLEAAAVVNKYVDLPFLPEFVEGWLFERLASEGFDKIWKEQLPS